MRSKKRLLILFNSTLFDNPMEYNKITKKEGMNYGKN